MKKAVVYSQCGNYGNSLSRIFGKNFVKVKVLQKKLLYKWFDEIIFNESKFPWFPQCGKCKKFTFISWKSFECDHRLASLLSGNYCVSCLISTLSRFSYKRISRKKRRLNDLIANFKNYVKSTRYLEIDRVL